MTKKYVYLGRFSPFHRGHERLLCIARNNFGSENCLCIVGSSNSLNERTPYSYETRVKMIRTIFPDLEILPLPDVQPELSFFDGSTNERWLDQIERLARERQEEFVFVGGSREDLQILATRFKTQILFDREKEGEAISATQIRNALNMINPKIMDQVINFDYKKNPPGIIRAETKFKGYE